MSTRTRILQGVTALAAVGLSGCALGLVGTWSLWFHPAAVQSAPITCDDGAPELPRGKRLRMLVWNVQYAAGRDSHFFYDGGDAVSVSPDTVTASLDAIADVIERIDPDIVVLQEVDRASRRTGRIDELTELLDRVPYACWADTPYHKAPYVPHPPHEHLGKVDMRLAVLSKYRIEGGTRVDLPRLDESWLRQQFNLKRALLHVELPIAGGGQLTVFDAHLSAFSKGDGTLPRQLDAIGEHIDAAGDAWILGADLNSLPPGDDPSRLTVHADLYTPTSPLTGWFDRYTPAVPLDELLTDPEPFRTWLPHGAGEPDRAIDYVFHGSDVEMHSYSVLQDAHEISDHLPLMFDFAIR